MLSESAGRSRIGLQNPKNVSNVGSALRAAGCFGAKAVYYNGDRYDRALPFARASDKHRHNVALHRVEALLDACPAHFESVAVELVVGAVPLADFQHPENALYLFGPEDGSLDQATVSQCDHVVYIPSLSCLNLAASVNVLLYDRAQKRGSILPSDQLIEESRDNRNGLKLG